MSTEKQICCRRVYDSGSSFSGRPCAKKATHEHEGKLYCAVHYPPNVVARRKKQDEKYTAEVEARIAKIKVADDERAEQKRRADCFPDLLEALELAVRLHELGVVMTDNESQRCRAAISKAKGQS